MKTIHDARKTITALILSAAGALFTPALLSAAVPASAASVGSLPDFTDLVDKVGPAVVNIRTTERVKPDQNGIPGSDDEEMQEFFRRFFGVPIPPRQQQQPSPRGRKQAPQQQEEEVPRGVGSGFIISADGYVLTNAHVVESADEVYVTLTDTRECKAKIIGSDKLTDVALVKIEGSNLPRRAGGGAGGGRAGGGGGAGGAPGGRE